MRKTFEIKLRFPIERAAGVDEYGDAIGGEISSVVFKRDYLSAGDIRRLVNEVGDLGEIARSKKLRTLAKLLLLESMTGLTKDDVDEIHTVDLAVLFVALDPFFPQRSGRKGGMNTSPSASDSSESLPTS